MCDRRRRRRRSPSSTSSSLPGVVLFSAWELLAGTPSASAGLSYLPTTSSLLLVLRRRHSCHPRPRIERPRS